MTLHHNIQSTKMASLLSGSNCPQLADKPKIFVIQASSGDRNEHGATRNSGHSLPTTMALNVSIVSADPSIGK